MNEFNRNLQRLAQEIQEEGAVFVWKNPIDYRPTPSIQPCTHPHVDITGLCHGCGAKREVDPTVCIPTTRTAWAHIEELALLLESKDATELARWVRGKGPWDQHARAYTPQDELSPIQARELAQRRQTALACILGEARGNEVKLDLSAPCITFSEIVEKLDAEFARLVQLPREVINPEQPIIVMLQLSFHVKGYVFQKVTVPSSTSPLVPRDLAILVARVSMRGDSIVNVPMWKMGASFGANPHVPGPDLVLAHRGQRYFLRETKVQLFTLPHADEWKLHVEARCSDLKQDALVYGSEAMASMGR